MLVFSKHKATRKGLALFTLLAALGAPGASLADQIKVLDTEGNPKFFGDLNQSSAATILVNLDGKSNGVSVRMLTSKNGTQLYQTNSDINGLATFENVRSGSYVIEADNAKITSVRMLANRAPSQKAAANDSTALYVGGVTAVAGGSLAAIALSNSGSSGSASDVSGANPSDFGREGGVKTVMESTSEMVGGATTQVTDDFAAFATPVSPAPIVLPENITPPVTSPDNITVGNTPPLLPDFSEPVLPEVVIPPTVTTPPPVVTPPPPRPSGS